MILVVDDDPPIRRMLERTLAAEGYEVARAADGGAALAAVERSVPDLVVLDVAMPGLDGLAVARRLRGRGPRRAPILLLTARDAVADRVAGPRRRRRRLPRQAVRGARSCSRACARCCAAARAPGRARSPSADLRARRRDAGTARRGGRDLELDPARGGAARAAAAQPAHRS